MAGADSRSGRAGRHRALLGARTAVPGLAHELRLSKLSAGVLTASYAIGTLIGSLPGGILVVRAGPKFAVLTGLALLLCSTVAFAFLENAAALDAARCSRASAARCSWAGGLAWIVTGHRAGAPGRDDGARDLGSDRRCACSVPCWERLRPSGRQALRRSVRWRWPSGLLIAWMRALPSVHVPSEQGVGTVIASLQQDRCGSRAVG